MSSEETQREVQKGKLNVQLKKLKDAIEAKNERMVSNHYTSMKTIFEAFENFHIQYLHKSKKAFEDDEQQQIYTEASDCLDEAHDIAGEYFSDTHRTSPYFKEMLREIQTRARPLPTPL